MKSALIGYTGFIGGNILKQKSFDDLYNSQNIKSIKGKKYDIIVSAATSAERWKANQNPKEDWQGIKKLLDNLESVKTKEFVLVSTVDVYPNPNSIDEDCKIDLNDFKQAYGKNRYKMELSIKKMFPKVTILRLPQTFGEGLKKNFVYDLIHGNALDFTHKDSSLQFYNLDNLWKDISYALKNKIPVLNLSVEPITAKELAKYSLNLDFKTITPNPPFSYNMVSKYKKYRYTKTQTLKSLKKFILKERSKTKISISNLAWEKLEDLKVLNILKKYQIAGIEVAPSKIWKNPTKVSLKEIENYRNLWKEKGIQIVAVTSLLFGHPELTIFETKEKREKTLNYLKRMIKFSYLLGAKVMVFGSPKNRLIGNLNIDKANKIAVSFFKKLGPELKKYNIVFCIEPVPQVYGADYLTNTSEAISLVKKINHSNIKVNLDTGAMKINKEDIEKTIKKFLSNIGHLHISEEGFKTTNSNKFGHKIIASLLKKFKYNNWASIEMWSKDGDDNLKNIEKSLEYVKKIYE